MRAGLLKERICISKPVEEQKKSGFVKKEFVDYMSCKAWRKRQTASPGDGINAKEEFIENTIILQIRFDPRIKETHRIAYRCNKYDIVLLDFQIQDNTYIVTAKKINE